MPFPRNYSNLRNEVDRIRQHFANSINRPCLIVGNGPSASKPNMTAEEISQCVIFRANWFFLEDTLTYGSRVDGFFCSVENKGLIQKLDDIAKTGPYTVGAYFQPFSSGSPSGERLDQPFALLPSYDHWAVIANNPTLARFFMGRPLPTQGMQMVAFAAALGFKDIRLAGVDMYAAAAKRYAWDVPEVVAQHLQEKDIKVGYEDKHSLDLDLMFLRAVQSEYDFRLTGVTQMDVLTPFFDKHSPAPIARVQVSPKRPNFAYATLVQGDYIYGFYALARSLQKVTDIPLVALYTDDHIGMRLRRIAGVIPKKVELLINPHKHGQTRFAATYTKLRAFELLEYDRVAVIDSDCVLLKNIDDVFHQNGFLAAPDWGEQLHDTFNSGLFVFSPSQSLLERVTAAIDSTPSADGGDQGFLNELFKEEWVRLPPEYNTLKRLLVHHPQLINISDVAVLHYVGKKPWQIETRDTGYAYLTPIWAQHLTESDWSDFFWHIHRKLSKPRRKQSRSSRGPIKSAILQLGRAITPPSLAPTAKLVLRKTRMI